MEVERKCLWWGQLKEIGGVLGDRRSQSGEREGKEEDGKFTCTGHEDLCYIKNVPCSSAGAGSGGRGELCCVYTQQLK